MKVNINDLLQEIRDLAPIYSKKFFISETGAEKFIRLAIKYLAKTEFNLKIDENLIIGEKKKLEKFRNEILNWDEDEFDEEDFKIIGYCQNIR
ncbi:MAG: hypothetical protein EU549_02845 [Promethearchaeota archaeon]|nr:MAG: hypothetical protein EU549_02845 [Candidatus Lokiarchaeota archaeon]